MKKTLLVLISSFMITGTMIAQDQAQDRDQTKIQQRDRIHQEDHLRLLDGKLYQYKQGVQSEVKEQVRLNNGMVINPDGSYQLKNQDRLQLRNGECLDMEGNRYLNQNNFNKRRMMTNKQIERMRSKPVNNNKPPQGNRNNRRN